MLGNEAVGEPKKSSPEPQSDDEELNIDDYGRTNRKGYIRLSIYHKMRKRQYGNRWMTQFVPLCREEVRRLEERKQMEENETIGNAVQDYLADMENDPRCTNSTHGVTL